MAPDYKDSKKDRHFGFMATILACIAWYAVTFAAFAIVLAIGQWTATPFASGVYTTFTIIGIVLAVLLVLECIGFGRTMHADSKRYRETRIDGNAS